MFYYWFMCHWRFVPKFRQQQQLKENIMAESTRMCKCKPNEKLVRNKSVGTSAKQRLKLRNNAFKSFVQSWLAVTWPDLRTPRQNFSLEVQENSIYIFFQKKMFLPKRSSKHVEFSFEKTSHIFLLKVQYNLGIIKLLCPKMFICTHKNQYWEQQSKIFSLKFRIIALLLF